MYCEDCNKYASNGLYECSCCRISICKDCYVDNKYLLCVLCYEKFRKGEINDQDIYSWLVKCEKCGNMWDGYAQCNCWEFDFSLSFENDNINENNGNNMTNKENE